MNGPNAVDESSFYLEYEMQVDATRDAVAKLAREVLQYEWADYLRAYPPEGPQTWEHLDSGKPWGRVMPQAWDIGRSQGFDLHFEHYPDSRALERGHLRLELHLEDGVHGDADFSGDSPYAALRERLVDALVDFTSGSDEVPPGDFGRGRTIWAADYRFTAGDTGAYYEALRKALSEHAVFVPVVTEALESRLAERE
ncbi:MULTISPECIES: acetyltransferase [Haloferax]|uniref:Acetyltransferase n=1 Tax=Haloferax marinum TaxID=2666143 RepID=A0A6A8G7X6_9EURY|nr:MULTISPECIES: acetyltransferase [Haloferax]KAB1198168.1 acetyltransferase [Haloferax sp. CBA1150]MRW97249.1 acetyltransferase [Haloferax marinum]